ncbi:DUF4334 domain-containing protein [Parahaliea maris]|uniref:DUF4334 domain-containing protein n=1 Tax=Parahaliea maris TaxID=2716870 RepID=A0A5C9A3J5_9GAMM|nr:DUF4334 domain-containing protein [Parahaliea maris]TXS95338.1 DUF4334 domain-containing protein [Parahaliea maris]
MSASHQFAELRDSDSTVAIGFLEAFFDSLPAVRREAMFGRWQGGCFNTGHPGEGMLDKLNWCGKQFNSDNDVNPIMVRSADGGMEVSDIMGQAQLRMVEYRGVVTATMAYDDKPIFDHFRAIDDDTLLGVMDSKGHEIPLFFYLERCPRG